MRESSTIRETLRRLRVWAIVVGTLATVCTRWALADTREWSFRSPENGQTQKFRAELLDVAGEIVVLKGEDDGVKYRTPIKNLSPADQEYIRSTPNTQAGTPFCASVVALPWGNVQESCLLAADSEGRRFEADWLKFSPDGERLLIGKDKCNLLAWNLRTGLVVRISDYHIMKNEWLKGERYSAGSTTQKGAGILGTDHVVGSDYVAGDNRNPSWQGLVLADANTSGRYSCVALPFLPCQKAEQQEQKQQLGPLEWRGIAVSPNGRRCAIWFDRTNN